MGSARRATPIASTARLLWMVGLSSIAACAQGPLGSIGVGGTPDFAAPGGGQDLAGADLAANVPGPDLSGAEGAPDMAPPSDFAVPCMPGTITCNGGCVDPMSDHDNCGACGQACLAGQACVAGQCACTAASCPNGCCAGGACQPGSADNACGTGGQACTACMTKCMNGGCLGCTPGAVDNQPCGNCGMHSRACDNNGVWGVFGMCNGQGACTPTSTRLTACGNCGSQKDTCDNNCQWQAGQCGGSGPCAAGATRKSNCGNCGTQTDTCGNNCQWINGGCAGSGPCAPNQTMAGGCDMCSQKVCGNNCQWGGCTLKPGNACEWKNGTNARPCGCRVACNGVGRQWCLPQTCQWSTNCACCNNVGCNMTCL